MPGDAIHFEEVDFTAVGQENKRCKALMFGNFAGIIDALRLGQLGIFDGSFGLDHRQHFAIFAAQAIIGNPVPGLGIIPGNRHFLLDPAVIAEIPAGFFKGWIN